MKDLQQGMTNDQHKELTHEKVKIVYWLCEMSVGSLIATLVQTLGEYQEESEPYHLHYLVKNNQKVRKMEVK